MLIIGVAKLIVYVWNNQYNYAENFLKFEISTKVYVQVSLIPYENFILFKEFDADYNQFLISIVSIRWINRFIDQIGTKLKNMIVVHILSERQINQNYGLILKLIKKLIKPTPDFKLRGIRMT